MELFLVFLCKNKCYRVFNNSPSIKLKSHFAKGFWIIRRYPILPILETPIMKPLFTFLIWLSAALFANLTVHGQFALYDDATNLGGGSYRLTQNQNSQRGAIWRLGLFDTSENWEMRAEVRLGGNNNGADGMAFVLKTTGSGNIGGGGGLMGFGGNVFTPAIEPSVIIEMDTYQGGGAGDPWYDHIGIQKNGSTDHTGADVLDGPVAAIPGNGNIEDNNYHDLRVTFNATNLEMVVYFDCVERLTTDIDIEDILGVNMIQWGFTAATGGASNTHRVRNAEWFTESELNVSDVEACPGEPVELAAPTAWTGPIWSPNVGLSGTTGNNVTATVDETTVYTIAYEDVCGDTAEDSLVLTVFQSVGAGLPNDTTLCNGESITLTNGPWAPGIAGTWEDGSTLENRPIDAAGEYALTIEDANTGCSEIHEISVSATDIPVFDLGVDFSFCSNEQAEFDLGPIDMAFEVLWNGVPGTTSYSTAETETVVLEWSGLGCSLSDTIVVSQYPTYIVTWEENPLILCLNETIDVPALDPDWTGSIVQWNWMDGSNANGINVSNSGNYAVDIQTENCLFTYDFDVEDSENQGIDLGTDVLLCGDDSQTLISSYDAANTFWVSGGTAEGINALGTTLSGASETVIVEIQIGECIEQDTVEVVHVPEFESDIATPLTLCLNDSVLLQAQPGADSYTWDNGIDESSQWTSSTGNYLLNISSDGCTFEEEIIVVPSANAGVDLGTDVVICDGEVLNIPSGYTEAETAWWENGSNVGNAENWQVTGMDAVIVAEVTIGGCVERDSISIDYAPVFDTGLPTTLSLCNGDSTLLTANPGAPSYEWSSGQLASSLWINSPGTYTLTVPVQGCIYTTDVAVQNIPLPTFYLGTDQTICEGQSIQFNTGLVNADLTVWSNGGDSAIIIVDTPGTFSAEVTENGCSFSDEVSLIVQELPIFDLGEDQLLCPDEYANLYIYPLPEEANVSWSNGNAQSSIEVNAPGTYSALVEWNGCTWTDEVSVNRAAPILIDIVEPLSFCEGGEMVVSAENPSNLFPISYDWSNGETTPAIVIERQGFYTIVAANACDTVSKSFEVQLDYCECPVYVPNAFTPDNDGVNDLFLPVLGCSTQDYRLEIYNPWGTLVFATEDPEKGWYGQVFGQVNIGLEGSEMSGYYTQNTVYNWRLVYRLEADESSLISPAPIEMRGHVHFVH